MQEGHILSGKLMPMGVEEKAIEETADVRLPWEKILFDKVFAFFILLLSLPFSLLITVAIKLEGLFVSENRGPVIYQETRVSQGVAFELYKFRIFKLAAIEQIKRGAITKEVENQLANLTGVGRLLKKMALDEVPQFWNVLKGDLSLVGPRPKPVAEYEEEVSKGIFRRKVIRAGLSGPAQIMKGAARTAEDELKADMDYIQQCRTLPGWKIFLIDLGMLWKTIRVLLKMTGE